MRKLLYIFSVIIAVFNLQSCAVSGKTPSITEPAAAKYVDEITSRPILKLNKFKQSDSIIYFTVKVSDMPANTKLTAVWKYLEDGTEVESELTTGGTGYEAFSLSKDQELFPTGQYEVTVKTAVGDRNLEVKGNFEILAEAEPTHILDPETSRTIDDQDTLNPEDITSEFVQDDDIIYFVIKTKDLPQDTRIICEWLYINTGEIITSDIITDGSRNIAFNLVPDKGQKFPPGKYKVTASTIVDNQIESVSTEFEIK